MKPLYISLQTETFSKQIFLISYTKDGGFFIKDLVRQNAQDKKCLITKHAADVLHHGRRIVTPSYMAYTTGEAKLTHHFDGNAQISGQGVISGYDENGRPKGAALKSFRLSETNDGGPTFTFFVWGCEHICRDSRKNDYILFPEEEYVHSVHQNEPLNAYAFKGYYIPKDWLPQSSPLPEKIWVDSPIDGLIQVTLLPSPMNTPGVIGLLATYVSHNPTDKFGFALSAAPTDVYDGRYCDTLSIFYPCKEISDSYVNLDYNV